MPAPGISRDLLRLLRWEGAFKRTGNRNAVRSISISDAVARQIRAKDAPEIAAKSLTIPLQAVHERRISVADAPPGVVLVHPTALPAATVSQERYRVAFEEANPGIAEALRAFPGTLVAAGGSANAPFRATRPDASGDVDLFVCGVPHDQLNAKLGDIVQWFNEHGRVTDPWMVSQRFLEFTWEGNRVQIILRAYENTAQLLTGFDLPCCSVAYDGTTTWLTDLAACSLLPGGATVLHPANRSPSFETRAAKYLARGYPVLLAGMNPDDLTGKAGVFTEYMALLGLGPQGVRAGNPVYSGTIVSLKMIPSDYYEPSVPSLQKATESNRDKIRREVADGRGVNGTPLCSKLSFIYLDDFIDPLEDAFTPLVADMVATHLKNTMTATDHLIRALRGDHFSVLDFAFQNANVAKSVGIEPETEEEMRDTPIALWKIDHPGSQWSGSFTPDAICPEEYFEVLHLGFRPSRYT